MHTHAHTPGTHSYKARTKLHPDQILTIYELIQFQINLTWKLIHLELIVIPLRTNFNRIPYQKCDPELSKLIYLISSRSIWSRIFLECSIGLYSTNSIHVQYKHACIWWTTRSCRLTDYVKHNNKTTTTTTKLLYINV